MTFDAWTRPSWDIPIWLRAFRWLMVSYLLVMQALHLPMGRADNGDYWRISNRYSSGPLNYDLSEWDFIYRNYFVPYWHLDSPDSSIVGSSVWLLLEPGVFLNRLVFSDSVLSLPVVSIVPRAVLVLTILGMFWWIDTSRASNLQRLILYVTLAAPMVLVASSTSYVAFVSSFLQESASLVFAFVCMVFLLVHRRENTRLTMFLALSGAYVFGLAKAASFYLPMLVVMFVVPLPRRTMHRRVLFLVVLAAAIAMSLQSLAATRTANSPLHSGFNSSYFGALTFSDDPAAHLARLGLAGTEDCVGISGLAVVAEEAGCLERTRDGGYGATVSVIAHEPVVALRMADFGFAHMQHVYLDYMGVFAIDDPRAAALTYDFSPRNQNLSTWYNIWATLQETFFPRGRALMATLAGCATVFALGLRKPGRIQDLSAAGAFAVLAVLAEIAIALLGDGRQELEKHLFTANLMFSFALMFALSVVSLATADWLVRRRLPVPAHPMPAS